MAVRVEKTDFHFITGKTLQVVDGYLVVTINPSHAAMSLDLSILNFKGLF
jgi:hypothetical protein